MKISEVITKLEQLKAKHGDLRCVCHDGLDPSDPAEVVDVELVNEYYEPCRIVEGKAVQICS